MNTDISFQCFQPKAGGQFLRCGSTNSTADLSDDQSMEASDTQSHCDDVCGKDADQENEYGAGEHAKLCSEADCPNEGRVRRLAEIYEGLITVAPLDHVNATRSESDGGVGVSPGGGGDGDDTEDEQDKDSDFAIFMKDMLAQLQLQHLKRSHAGGQGVGLSNNWLPNVERKSARRDSLFLTEEEYNHVHLIKFRLADSEAEREEMLDALDVMERKKEAAEQALGSREEWLKKQGDCYAMRRDMDRMLAERAVLQADNTTLQQQLSAVTKQLERALVIPQHSSVIPLRSSFSEPAALPSSSSSSSSAAAGGAISSCSCGVKHAEHGHSFASDGHTQILQAGGDGCFDRPGCDCPELLRVLKATKDIRQENADKTADLDDLRNKFNEYIDEMTLQFAFQSQEINELKLQLRRKDEEVTTLKDLMAAHEEEEQEPPFIAVILDGKHHDHQGQLTHVVTTAPSTTSSPSSSLASSPNRQAYARTHTKTQSGASFFARFRKNSGTGSSASASGSSWANSSSSTCSLGCSSDTCSTASGGGGGGGSGSTGSGSALSPYSDCGSTSSSQGAFGGESGGIVVGDVGGGVIGGRIMSPVGGSGILGASATTDNWKVEEAASRAAAALTGSSGGLGGSGHGGSGHGSAHGSGVLVGSRSGSCSTLGGSGSAADSPYLDACNRRNSTGSNCGGGNGGGGGGGGGSSQFQGGVVVDFWKHGKGEKGAFSEVNL